MQPDITEEQKKAAAFLTRKVPRFEPKSPERLVAEAQAAAEEQARLDAETISNAQIGDTMPDGSVFAGRTPDSTKLIFAMPTDLDVTITFNKAAKAVDTLNTNKTLGHDDWEIPSLENLRVLYKNRNEGALKGAFNTNKGGFFDSNYPDWYWSSTEDRGNPSGVWDVRFSDGDVDWNRKDDNRLSCRPVRLVAASAPAPAPV